MSMSECNLCSWERIQRDAKKGKYKIRLIADAYGSWSKAQKVQKFENGEWKDTGTWFARVPERCGC